ncbi:MAG: hypothetical protein CVT60_03040 [Actinobacteria bacterium HGW-Actinobacteria-10]|jgi:VanZ family protein|nr:MAG: hypothetical protein CVT60_03040 [Actinobacteria bacterium HGW-Actinobacteria-10]
MAVAGWMALIFRVSSMSSPGLPSGWGNPAHFGAYAVLGALCMFALGPAMPADRALGLAVLISSAYGMTDEIHQSFVPGRVPDIVDWGFDTLGSAVGAFAVIMAWRMLARKYDGHGG